MKKNKTLYQLICIAFVLLIAYICINAYKIIHQSGNTDIRSRIVAARMVDAGYDPYVSLQSLNLADRLVDPYANPFRPITRASITPFNILLHIPLSKLPFPNIVKIWYLMQIVLFLIAFSYLFFRLKNRVNKSIYLVFSAVILIKGSLYSHLYLGQIYIFYLFLGTTVLFLLDYKKGGLTKSCLISILALARPTYLLIPAAFFINKKRVIAKITSLLSAILFFVSLPIIKLSYWISFVKYVFFIGSNITAIKNTHNPSITYPRPIEGSVAHLNTPINFLSSNSSFKGLVETTFNLHLSSCIPIILFAILLLTVFGMIAIANKKLSNHETYFVGILLSVTSEFFIPAPRYIYADIQWLLLISMLLNQPKSQPNRKEMFSFMSLTLIVYLVYPAIGSWLIAAYFFTTLAIRLKEDSG